MPDPLDVIAEIVALHRLAWDVFADHRALCRAGCDWEYSTDGAEVAHSRHVVEVIRDVLAPERVEWSLRQGSRVSFGNEAQCRQTQATRGGAIYRRVRHYWPDEVNEWERVS